MPIARSIARAGARSNPSVTSLLRGFISRAIRTTYARYYLVVQGKSALLWIGTLGIAAVAGCGVEPHNTISATSAAAEIAGQLESRYGVKNPPVNCPADIPDKKGQQFSCTAVLDGQPVTMSATVTASSGAFTVAPTSAIIVVSSLISEVTDEIAHQVGQTPVVSCGDKSILVVDVGDTVTCTATFPGEQPRLGTVTVVDLNGRFTLSLPGAGATSTSQTPP
jgi:hypothetical protein